MPTVDHGPLGPVRTVELTLSEPTDGLVLGGRTTQQRSPSPRTATCRTSADVTVLANFEVGVPAGIHHLGRQRAGRARPVLPPTCRATGAGNGPSPRSAGPPCRPATGSASRHDIAATDWSALRRLHVLVPGHRQRQSLRYELKSGGATPGQHCSSRSVVDDTAGWRQVKVAFFADLRLKGNPAVRRALRPGGAHGFAVTLTDLGAATWTFDDLALYERVSTIEDFEGDVPIDPPSSPVGLLPLGHRRRTKVNLERHRAGARRLAGRPTTSCPAPTRSRRAAGAGSATTWRPRRTGARSGGIRFWWYASQDDRPASPTAGDDIVVELKDGGPDGEHSELWAATFKDNWSSDGSRWKLVDLPFSQFTRSDYQPGAAATRNGMPRPDPRVGLRA